MQGNQKDFQNTEWMLIFDLIPEVNGSCSRCNSDECLPDLPLSRPFTPGKALTAMVFTCIHLSCLAGRIVGEPRGHLLRRLFGPLLGSPQLERDRVELLDLCEGERAMNGSTSPGQ